MNRFLEELDRRKHTTPKTVPCRWCGKPTEMTATKLCDAHWELEKRITAEPHIAARILAKINNE